MNSMTVLVAHAYEPRHIASLQSLFPDIHFVQLAKDGTVPPGGEQARCCSFSR